MRGHNLHMPWILQAIPTGGPFMSEMRWDPVLREWVVTATHRLDRTYKPPEGFCPLCPSAPSGTPTEIPRDDFEIVVFENKFPSFRQDPPEPALEGTDLFRVMPSRGICEVVVYSPKHRVSMSDQPVKAIERLVRVWTDRYRELGDRDFVKYVLIFENRGEEVGVTLHHPHGQIYAMPAIPPKVARELESARIHRERTGRCLFCDIIEEECRDGRRIVAQNSHFIAAVPFYAHFPYEVHVHSLAHAGSLADFGADERRSLAAMLKLVTAKYDRLFSRPMPYMLIMHQSPTDGGLHEGYHFHIEFYPLLRSSNKLKFLAGSESGGGTFINDTVPEEKAEELREAAPRGFAELGD